MLHFHSLAGLELHDTWVTIGMFDGVHRGHQSILAPLVKEAHASGRQAVVLTFFPHPAVVLRGMQDPFYLTTSEERAELLGKLGIDVVITLPFDKSLAAMSAEDFMKRVQSSLGMRHLWVGFDFALGRNRQGDIPTLRRLGETLGYNVVVIPEVTVDSARVSSSQIRKMVQEGSVEQAARALGRPYAIEGRIVQGDSRGQQLGFPTANLDHWPKKILPANGVYATWAWVGGSFPGAERVASVTNVGVRPTFQGVEHRIEAHLLNFNRDLYGKPLKLEFIQFLRPERRFPSIDALIAQITTDKQHAEEILVHEP